MSQPCWSCFGISAPLTPCWGPVSLFSVPEQVGRHRVGSQWTRSRMQSWQEKLKPNISLISCSLLSGSVCDLHYEVLPESETSFSVTFQRPDTNSLAVCKRSLQIITKIKLSLIRRSLRASTCEKPFRSNNNGLYSSNLVWSLFVF